MRIIAVLIIALSTTIALAGSSPLTSGPQVGKNLPGSFHPYNVTGASAGKKNCLVCQHGTSPVAMVFAHEISPSLTKLLKELDVCTDRNKTIEMGSFAIFLTDREELADDLKKLATKESLKNLTLAIDEPAGPKDYQVAKDADVTVVLYLEHKVKANFAYRKGELNDAGVAEIMKNMSKITTK